MDIGQWLRGLGMQSYEQAFRDNGIDLEVLPRLTADDLKEIGVPGRRPSAENHRCHWKARGAGVGRRA